MKKSVAVPKLSLRAPVAPVGIAFIAGILLGRWGLMPMSWWSVMGGVVAVMTLVMHAADSHRARRHAQLIGLLVLWMCLGALRMQVWRVHPQLRFASVLSDEPRAIAIHGIVRDDPAEVFAPSASGAGLSDAVATGVVDVEHLRVGDAWQARPGRLRVTVPARVRLAYGDEVVLEGAASLVPPAGNPGQYDWRAALARQRVQGLLRVRSFDGATVLRHRQGPSWIAAMFWLRSRWQHLLQQAFDDEPAGLLRSLLLGQRVALDEPLRRAFLETGTIHLLVISGFNVGLIAGLLELALRLFGVPWRLRLAMAAMSLAGYSVLTGFQPPVVRATVMAWVVLGTIALDRPVSWFNTIALAALAILAINPPQLFDPGFQLSFGAVLSLLLFTTRWQPVLDRWLAWLRPPWLRRYLATGLAATVAVWIGLAPTLAWDFYLMTPVSVLANLLITPLVSVLVVVGTGVLTLATVIPRVLWMARLPLDMLLHLLVGTVRWCQAIPGASWLIGRPAAWWLASYYAVLVGSLVARRHGWTLWRIFICWLAAGTCWVWVGVAHRALASHRLQLTILDVGHGDSIVLRTPAGHTILIDAGTQEAGRSRVLPFLESQGIRTLDLLVLTHPDEDHLGGAVPILERLRVQAVLTNGVTDVTMSARRVEALLVNKQVPRVVAQAGTLIREGVGLELRVLNPPSGLVPGAEPASNDNSVVIKVRRGSVSALLTGDLEEQGVPWVLREPDLASTILKVPHHGSRLGAAGERLFRAVRPAVSIISVGRLHHLPAPQTVRALRRVGTALYTTQAQGAIEIRTDGVTYQVNTFTSGTATDFPEKARNRWLSPIPRS